MPINLLENVSPDSLRETAYRWLIASEKGSPAAFVVKLDAILREQGLNLWRCLVPLGISATTPEELTPYEIATIIRYLKYNHAGVLPAVIAALEVLAPTSPRRTNVKAKSSRVPRGCVSGHRTREHG